MATTNGVHRKQNVCVFGAGPAGLCAARHLSEQSSNFSYDHFEMTSQLGGQWVFTDTDKDTDANGFPLHSCMYRDLM